MIVLCGICYVGVVLETRDYIDCGWC